jgi:hypothetical protein
MGAISRSFDIDNRKFTLSAIGLAINGIVPRAEGKNEASPGTVIFGDDFPDRIAPRSMQPNSDRRELDEGHAVHSLERLQKF